MKKGSNTGLFLALGALAAFGIYSVTSTNKDDSSDGLTKTGGSTDKLQALRNSVIALINAIPAYNSDTKAKMINAVNVMTSSELNDMYTIMTNVKNGGSINAMDTITKVLAIQTKYGIFNLTKAVKTMNTSPQEYLG